MLMHVQLHTVISGLHSCHVPSLHFLDALHGWLPWMQSQRSDLLYETMPGVVKIPKDVLLLPVFGSIPLYSQWSLAEAKTLSP